MNNRADYLTWLRTLTSAQQWLHCGRYTAHLPHIHTICYTGETPNPVECGGTPDFPEVLHETS